MKEKNEKNLRNPESVVISPELAARAKAGDQAAFTELYELSYRKLYRTIHSMVRDEDPAWDILQDSYIRAWRGLDKLESGEAFLPWLRRIAVNVTATQMAQKRTLTFTDLAGDEDEGAVPDIPDLNTDNQPELALDRQETSRLVREILAELPEAQQMILGMHYYEDMTIKEIAETLRIAPGTVKVQLFRGRKKVETAVRALEKRGVKLYGLSPLPFLLALLRRLEPGQAAEQKALAAVLAEAPAAGAAAGGSAVTVTAMTAGQAFLHGLGTKLLAGALAVALLIGGKLAYDAVKKGKAPRIGDVQSTAEETVKLTEPELSEETTLPQKLCAPDNAPENACGPDLTWRYDEDTAVLTIEGSGEMYDYPSEEAPWYNHNSVIKAINLPEGLTHIGDYAFSGCWPLDEVTFPESVTSIGRFAFDNCYALRSVAIPAGVTRVQEGAFGFCSALQSVTIPEGVTVIEDRAFYACTSLASVELPESLAELGAEAFASCDRLESFSVPSANGCFTADDNGVLYSKDRTKLLACSSRYSGRFVIPEGVTVIGEGAFSGCSSLTALTIPEGVTSIESYAMFYCNGLSSISLPASVSFIGEGAFAYCNEVRSYAVSAENAYFMADETGTLYNKEQTALIVCPSQIGGSYEIPESVTSIYSYAFCYCKDLCSLTIPAGVTYIGDYAFCWCESLASLSLPWGISAIGDYAFYHCYGLSALTIPESVRSIGEYAFYSCEKLTAMTIPEGVTSIGASAFGFCEALTSVTFPESLTTIGKNAFFDCPVLRTAELPTHLTDIGRAAFRRCEALSSVTIPEGVTAIAPELFRDCINLTSVTIPDGVSSIGKAAFSGCVSLTDLAIPGTVTSIGIEVFLNCRQLSSITIPEGVTSIQADAFSGCGLVSVTIPEGVTHIGDHAFEGCSALTDLTISEGVSGIGDRAFAVCTALTKLTIPESVTFIGEHAFGECDSLMLRGAAGSEAERYANEYDIPFEAKP